jgi:hypothetical protein
MPSQFLFKQSKITQSNWPFLDGRHKDQIIITAIFIMGATRYSDIVLSAFHPVLFKVGNLAVAWPWLS